MLIRQYVLPQHLDDCLICTFCGAVSLWMECRQHPEFSASEFIYLFPEGAREQ